MPKIIVTGPESSGKTTLCKALAKHFNIPFTNEFARKYIDTLDRTYTQTDLLKIAKGQLQSEAPKPKTKNQKLSIHDTDLITIKIWSQHKYNKYDNWILEQIENQKSENRFYLLCKPDILWEHDPQRESPGNRDKLFTIYKKELGKLGYNYFIVKGKNRIEKSISKISNLIS